MVTAVVPIAKGDMITVSYLGEVMMLMGQQQRRDRLCLTKGFVCGCSRCAIGRDTPASLPCPRCKTGMIARVLSRENSVPRSWSCDSCAAVLAQDQLGCDYTAVLALERDIVGVNLRVDTGRILPSEILSSYNKALSLVGPNHWTTNITRLILCELAMGLLRFNPRDLEQQLILVYHFDKLWSWTEIFCVPVDPAIILSIRAKQHCEMFVRCGRQDVVHKYYSAVMKVASPKQREEWADLSQFTGENTSPSCFVCKRTGIRLMCCGKCRQVHYCDKVHQKFDWPEHKWVCK